MYNLIILLAASFVALTTVNWAYFKILRIAKEKNLVDNPDARKLQKTPIPVMGGISVFIGVVAGVFAGLVAQQLLGIEPSIRLIPAILSMVIMLYIGALDDIIGLTPISRITIEVLSILGLIYVSGGCIDSLHELWGVSSFSWWIAVPLTIFAGVGIINAVNMIDGVNGLSSGLCITYCVLFGIAFIKVDDINNAILAFTMAAALLPFLVHNVFGLRSRMFIGDAGTMVMGMLMVWFIICLLRSDNGIKYFEAYPNTNMIAFAIAVLSVPIADTLRVMTMRVIHHKSPFSADKTHLHHAFIRIGFAHSITALSEIMIDLVVVLVWIISIKLHATPNVQLYTVILSSMIFVWGTYVLLHYVSLSYKGFLHWLTKISIKSHLGRKNWWKSITRYLDSPEDRMIARLSAKEQVKIKSSQRFANVDPNDPKEMNRKRIYEFMKGRAEVFFEDILRNSGADVSLVPEVIKEEIDNGFVKVIRLTDGGGYDILALTEEMK